MTYTSQTKLREIELGNEIVSLALLKSIVPTEFDEHALIRLDDGRVVYYSSTCILAADDIFVIQAKGPGRYLLAPGFVQRLPLSVSFATADAAVLATAPTNFRGRVLRGDWGVPSIAWTGGASSAIGLSSSNANHSTKGDLHGATGGDVAASLTTGGFRPGTVGTDIAGGAYIVAGDAIRFDRIVSAFTAGATVAGIEVFVHSNPGA